MKPTAERILQAVIPLVYARRRLTFGLMLVLTVFLAGEALRLRPDAGFEKEIPLDHPYMKVFKQYEQTFGGANLITIALMKKDDRDAAGIYDPTFLDRLHKLSDATFFLPGVDRAHVSSLFTPDITYFEVVEGGINLGNVIPRNYAPTPEMMATIREHVGRANVIGRYVSRDQHGALIVASLLEHHPVTHEKLDYVRLADQLEDQLRARIESPRMWEYRLRAARAPYQAGDVVWRGYSDYGWRLRFQTFEAARKDDDGKAIFVGGDDVVPAEMDNPDYAPGLAVHIIGFAKVVGDVTDASLQVLGFFAAAIVLIAALLWVFCGSFRLSLLPLFAALTAVIWELGLLRLAGFGADPFAILVPFLILSIGVSHGVQYINAWSSAVTEQGLDPYRASVASFRQLFLPGTVAIMTNVIGFATLMFIHIDIVREMALNAAMGMAAVIITNKVMLPIALTWVPIKDPERFRARQRRREAAGSRLWRGISAIAEPRCAMLTLLFAAMALAWSFWMYPRLTIGDSQVGVPELRADSRYNRDSAAIAANFGLGVDILKVIVETHAYGCIDAHVMDSVDRFIWRMTNTPGVQFAYGLPNVARQIRGLYNEGSPKWEVLPRDSAQLAALTGGVPSSVGLQNADCSRLPVFVFTTDHRATTISRLVAAVKQFDSEEARSPDGAPGAHYALASGNVGVMAATNEEIEQREILVIVWVHLTLLAFVWISFRSWASVVCIITPLVTCSLLTYGFMALTGIGMKAATLPVAAFGVGLASTTAFTSGARSRGPLPRAPASASRSAWLCARPARQRPSRPSR